MSFLTIASCILLFVYEGSSADIMPKLKRNILNLGYRVNFKYEGMLSTKDKRPKTSNILNLTLHAVMLIILVLILINAKLLKYCMKIMPYTQLYQRQIQYYNWTAYDTLTNDIGKNTT